MKKIFLFVAALCATVALNAKTITLEPGEGKIAAAIAEAEAGDVIELTGDAQNEYTEWNSIALDKAITLKAAAGATPVVHMPKIKMNAEFTVEGIEFYGFTDYLFRTETGGDFSITFRNCHIHDNPAYFIYISSGQSINALTIDGCIFHDNSKDENAVVNGSGTIGTFTFTNNTVYNIPGKFALRVQHYTNAIIDHCTFYNCGERPMLMAENDHTAAAVSNTVVANPAEVTSYCIATYAGTVDNCVYYNTASGAHSGPTITNLVNADPKFVNAAEGNFNFTSDSPLKGAATDGSNIGDPRWKEAAAQLAISFTAPAADYEEAMNDYTIKFAAVVPEGTAKYTISYSYDQETWKDIVTDVTYVDQTEAIFATRGLEEGEVTLRATLATETESVTAYSKILNIVKDTRAPRAIANFEAAIEGATATLTWQNPTVEVPIGGSLLGDENLLEGASVYGTTATLAVEDNTVKVTATAGAWAQVGISFDATAFENVQNVAFKVKGDPAVQLDVFVVQNGYDWWHKAFYPTADWMTFDNNEWSKVDWHNNSKATTFDGNNVTNVMITIDNGVDVSNSVFYLDSVMVEGIIAPSQYYAKTIIRRSETDYPATIEDGDAVYEGNAETTTDEIDPTKTYYYTAFAVDDIANVSEPTTLLVEGKEVTHTLFNVTVPAGTDACYLVGSFNSWEYEDGIEMTKVDETHYTYQAESDLTNATYRYYHGDEADTQELSAEGQVVTRTVNATVMEDEVARWQDGSTTGLNNAKAAKVCVKAIRNGQFVILKNNVRYNILGAQL